MLQLDESVELVALQFSFSNPSIVPDSIRQVVIEHLVYREIRKSRESAEKVVLLEPTGKVYLAYLIEDLKTVGYEVVDALYQPRVDPKDPAGKKIYHMVRFLFARTENSRKIHKGFLEIRPKIYTELDGMCVESMWRARAILNPFFKSGEEISGRHALSINLEARMPLFDQSGKLIQTWEKDDRGNRIGDAPVPLTPDYCLRITDGCLKLV